MKIYRINRVDCPIVYKTSKEELQSWIKRNPGECQSWDEVDLLEELDRLSEIEYNHYRTPTVEDLENS